MYYSRLLRKYIKYSGKTLKKISSECLDLGVSITPSYICKLKNGKSLPASDKVNKAIATVIGCSPEELILAAYRQKIPVEIIGKLAVKCFKG